MSLAQIMATHGKALGPLGVAVYAWIDANPGSTFKEVADGMGMGESTVKRCVRQFEGLGIAGRRIETTPKGLALPTRIFPGTIERGTSDNPLPVRTPSPQNPGTIEPPENAGVSLSDPGTIERGTSGTEVAPSKALRTSTDKELSLSARATPTEPKRERGTRFSREVREAYAKARGCGDGWLHTSRDGRYDDLIERWQQSAGSEQSAAQATAVKPAQLTPEESQCLITKAASLLREGADIADLDRQFTSQVPRSQWATIRSAAQAQAKVSIVPAATPSPPAAQPGVVVPMRASR